MPEPILIFDLDGTLLAVNSFPHWVRYMLFGEFGGLTMAARIVLSLRTAHVLAHRKLLGARHDVTKHRLQRLWTEALAKDPTQLALHRFCDSLLPHVRPNLKNLVTKDSILATSAAAEYAQALGKTLGFTHILATETGQPENVREQKRDRILALLAAQGWGERPRILFTDHEDDLPLIRECRRTLWFGSESDMAAAKATGNEIIYCRDIPAAEISKLIG